MKIIGFDWDNGNWPKCGRHGVSKAEIEFVLRNMAVRFPDPFPHEDRFRTAGATASGRFVFLVFTYREDASGKRIRPLSVRYMHQKEVDYYEQLKESLANPEG